ncbi:DUF5999 family protein [Streptomyces virginiae]
MDQPPPPACRHSPPCPRAEDSSRGEAQIVSAHPEQGWNLLCNGVLMFDDDAAMLLPDGQVIASPRRVVLDGAA